MAARSGCALIADAQGIADHLRRAYGRQSYLIPYGAPIISAGTDKLSTLGVASNAYHLVVARMEPENHVDIIVDGYARSGSRLPLLVVGDSPYGNRFAEDVRRTASGADARFVGGVWDEELRTSSTHTVAVISTVIPSEEPTHPCFVHLARELPCRRTTWFSTGK